MRDSGGRNTMCKLNNLNLQIVILMQPTLESIDQFPNLASIIDDLQEDDCGVYV